MPWAMRRGQGRAFFHFEILEERTLLSAALDLVGVTAMRTDPAFAGIDGSGITVAIIDTGIDSTHPLLAPNYLTGFDFIHNDNTPDDEEGHGTHVAGIIGATDPDIGVAPGVHLISLKIGGQNGSSRVSWPKAEAALQWVDAHKDQYNIKVVNMSIGSGFFTSVSSASSDILFDDVRRLQADGITVVSAAGNEFADNQTPGSGSPGIFSTLDVGAVWDKNEGGPIPADQQYKDFTTGADRITFFSDRPNTPNNVVFAPGALIRSTYPGGGFAVEGGTSQASPLVAGIVALMQQTAFQVGGRYLTPAEVQNLIHQSAHTINDGDDEDTSVAVTHLDFPRVNAYAAVQDVVAFFQGATPPPAPPPPGGPPAVSDPNGTIAGAFLGPTLVGDTVESVSGAVGTDGGVNQVGPSDVDMIQFTVSTPGTLTLDMVSPDGTSSFDAYLRLFDSNGNQIAVNDDKAQGDVFPAITVPVSPGTYYAGVSGYPNTTYDPTVPSSGVAGATGSYQLNFSLATADPNGVLAGAVPVDVSQAPKFDLGFIGADNATVSDTGQVVSGTNVGPADVDLFRISIPDNGTLTIDVDTPYDSGFVDSYLNVFAVQSDGSLIRIASNDDGGVAPGTDGHNIDSLLNLPVTTGQDLVIGVSDVHNQNYDPNTTAGRDASGTGGLYNINFAFTNNDQDGRIPTALSVPVPLTPLPDAIGTDFDTAGNPLSVGDRDVDFYHFRIAKKTQTLQVNLTPDGAAPLNGVLTLWDSAGNALFISDGNGGPAAIQWVASPGVDYYVSVSGAGNDTFDPFQVATGTSGATGDYSISAFAQSSKALKVLSNDAISGRTPTPIFLNQQVSGDIGSDGDLFVGSQDIDLYRFIPSTTGSYTITTGVVGDFNSDTFLRLFDTKGREIAFNDDVDPSTSTSLITATLTARKAYYIGVNGFSNAARFYSPKTGKNAAPGSNGGYTLTVTQDTGSTGSILTTAAAAAAVQSFKTSGAITADPLAKHDGGGDVLSNVGPDAVKFPGI